MGESSQSSQSSQGYLADLVDGVNFHVIPGKHSKSKLVIKGDYAYTVDKKVASKDGGKSLYYMRCKYKQCKVRGVIKNNFLTLAENHVHSCVADGAGVGRAKWMAQAALARMRERAAKETSSFDVSINQMIA